MSTSACSNNRVITPKQETQHKKSPSLDKPHNHDSAHDIIHHATVDILAHLAEHFTHSQSCGIGVKIANTVVHPDENPIGKLAEIAVDSIPGLITAAVGASHSVGLATEATYFTATKLAEPIANKLAEEGEVVSKIREREVNNTMAKCGDSKFLQAFLVTDIDNGLNSQLLELQLGLAIAENIAKAVSTTKEVANVVKKGLEIGADRILKEIASTAKGVIVAHCIAKKLAESIADELTEAETVLGKAQAKELNEALAKCSDSKFLESFFATDRCSIESKESARDIAIAVLSGDSRAVQIESAKKSSSPAASAVAEYLDHDRKQSEAGTSLISALDAVGKGQNRSEKSDSQDKSESKSNSSSCKGTSSSAVVGSSSSTTSGSKTSLTQETDRHTRDLNTREASRIDGKGSSSNDHGSLSDRGDAGGTSRGGDSGGNSRGTDSYSRDYNSASLAALESRNSGSDGGGGGGSGGGSSDCVIA